MEEVLIQMADVKEVVIVKETLDNVLKTVVISSDNNRDKAWNEAKQAMENKIQNEVSVMEQELEALVKQQKQHMALNNVHVARETIFSKRILEMAHDFNYTIDVIEKLADAIGTNSTKTTISSLCNLLSMQITFST